MRPPTKPLMLTDSDMIIQFCENKFFVANKMIYSLKLGRSAFTAHLLFLPEWRSPQRVLILFLHRQVLHDLQDLRLLVFLESQLLKFQLGLFDLLIELCISFLNLIEHFLGILRAWRFINTTLIKLLRFCVFNQPAYHCRLLFLDCWHTVKSIAQL